MDGYLNWKVVLLVVLALVSFANACYVRNNSSEAVKAKCAREPVDFLYRNQYSDCLRRNM